MTNHKLALEDFEKAIVLKPQYYKAHSEAAYIYALLKDETAAMNKYDVMVKNGCSKEESDEVKAKILSILKN